MWLIILQADIPLILLIAIMIRIQGIQYSLFKQWLTNWESMGLNMFKKILLTLTGLGAAGVLIVYLLTIPLLRRLPKQSRISMDGITTIDDAVKACKRTLLQEWDLVAYAQNLAAKKFTYSRLNTWDTASNRHSH